MFKKMLTSVTALLLLLAACLVHAGDTFRCGSGQIVSVGDLLPDVYVKCGEPTFRDRRIESSGVGYGRWGHSEIVTVEDWIYNLGANEFMYRLIFSNNRLVRIESLDHGFNVYEEPPPRP